MQILLFSATSFILPLINDVYPIVYTLRTLCLSLQKLHGRPASLQLSLLDGQRHLRNVWVSSVPQWDIRKQKDTLRLIPPSLLLCKATPEPCWMCWGNESSTWVFSCLPSFSLRILTGNFFFLSYYCPLTTLTHKYTYKEPVWYIYFSHL